MVALLLVNLEIANNMNKLVSIVMPTYNSGSYIKEAIDSIVNQTYQQWELIIVDDASKDNTKEILASYKDKRIKIYNNEVNKGVAYSRNKGISLCLSDIVAFLDSDDIWDKYKLEKQISLYSNEKQFIFTGSYFIDESGNKNNYELKVPERIDKQELLKHNLISCSSVMINKAFLLKRPFPEVNNIHEDYVTWLQILDNVKYAYGINESLLTYRLRKSSKSFNKLNAAIMNIKAYRYVGLSTTNIIKNMFFYIVNSLKKYEHITTNRNS